MINSNTRSPNTTVFWKITVTLIHKNIESSISASTFQKPLNQDSCFFQPTKIFELLLLLFIIRLYALSMHICSSSRPIRHMKIKKP